MEKAVFPAALSRSVEQQSLEVAPAPHRELATQRCSHGRNAPTLRAVVIRVMAAQGTQRAWGDGRGPRSTLHRGKGPAVKCQFGVLFF